MFALRVEPQFVSELGNFIATLQAQYPWVRLTRSDALRWLLEDGLGRMANEEAEA
ncbi:MAG: hypothetical protein ACAI25_05925 [Planctomycetota bacterium]